MIVFEGSLSNDVKEKALKRKGKKNRTVTKAGTVISGLLIITILIACAFNPKIKLSEIFFGQYFEFIWAVILAFVAFLGYTIYSKIRPFSKRDLEKDLNFKIQIDEDEIVYFQKDKFGSNKILRSSIRNVCDDDNAYIIYYGDKWNEIICEKSLLKEGTLENFEDIFFEDVSFASNNSKKKKFKKHIHYKKITDFKLSIIGIICAVLSIALIYPFIKFGLSVVLTVVPKVASWLFKSGFICEIITFIIAIVGLILVAVILFVLCWLLVPALAITSVVLPILDLKKGEHWFNKLSLIIGIVAFLVCILITLLLIGVFA